MGLAAYLYLEISCGGTVRSAGILDYFTASLFDKRLKNIATQKAMRKEKPWVRYFDGRWMVN